VVIGRIVSECHERRRRGERVDIDSLARAHPEYAEDIKREWSLLQGLILTNRANHDDDIRAYAAFGQLRIGAAFGDFELVEALGAGGSSVVFKAREEKLNRFVALKILRPELASDRIGAKRFEREAMTVGGLRHPNIVSVYRVGRIDELEFIAMEYIDGPSLATLIRDHAPLHAETAQCIFDGIISGVRAAHAAGVIHRDIKPANILIDRDADRIPRIVDFGLARTAQATTQLTLPESVIGTIEYMSPEQARGDSDIDERTDYYSAGVVLYEMLTGIRPFKSETISGTLHRVLNETPIEPRKLLTGIDANLSQIATSLMSKDRAMRRLEGDNGERSGATRLIRRTALTLALLGLLIAGGLYLAPNSSGAAGESPPAGDDAVETELSAPSSIRIRDARILKGFPSDIYVWYDDDAESHVLPIKNRSSNLNFLAVTTCQTSKGTFVIAANDTDVDGANIFVYDSTGGPIGNISLQNSYAWPDCPNIGQMKVRPGEHLEFIRLNRPSEYILNDNVLFCSDLDNDGEEEVVIVARDHENYPTRITIVEPFTWKIRRTFWHMGEIHFVRTLDDYFGPNRPALLALGCNNKLDGFGEPPPYDYIPLDGEAKPVTKFNYVPIAMILDPMSEDFNGLGPPFTERIRGLRPVSTIAYAYLDVPATPLNYTDDATQNPYELAAAELSRIHEAEVRTAGRGSPEGDTILLRIRSQPTLKDRCGEFHGTVLVNMRLHVVLKPDGTPKSNTADDIELTMRWRVYPPEEDTPKERPPSEE